MEETVIKAEQAFRAGDSQEAIVLLSKVLTHNPNHPRALISMGVILQAVGRSSEAVKAFDKLLSLDEGHGEARKNLALTLISMNEYDKARPHLERLLSANQNDSSLWTLLAKLEKAGGRPKAALEHAKRSLLLKPDQPEVEAFISSLQHQPEASSHQNVGARHLTVMCPPYREESLAPVLPILDKQLNLVKVVNLKPEPYFKAVGRTGPIWLEGCWDISAILTKDPSLLAGRQVVLRLDRNEVLEGAYKNIVFERITDIVFETNFLREQFVSSAKNIRHGTRLHVFSRPIDLANFKPLPSERKGIKIAATGPFDLFSGFMVMLETFRRIIEVKTEVELHLTGTFSNFALQAAFAHFIAKSGFAKKVFISPNVPLKTFLSDKDFYLAAPLVAGGPGPAEAVNLGLRPLIKDCPGMSEALPASCLWNTPQELMERFEQGPNFEEVRAFIAARHAPEVVAKIYQNILKA
ncbi:MAG: tetratricopeptide repeat protein [Deltaproteobacteria bacterium]|jgi:tetratricopeptide (TPR) repeat protein|nr:tetratricopeptide repeat protein [Deltaproteobacteria bacterium]